MEWNPSFTIKIGHDAKTYAVFKDHFDLIQWQKQHPDQWKDKPIASFGQFENALRID